MSQPHQIVAAPPGKGKKKVVSSEGVTPLTTPPAAAPGIPQDIIETTIRRFLDLNQGEKATLSPLPLTFRNILQDAVISAYQRGQSEARAESDLLFEASESVHSRRAQRMIDLAVHQCMTAANLTHLTIDLDAPLAGNLITQFTDDSRSKVTFNLEHSSEL